MKAKIEKNDFGLWLVVDYSKEGDSTLRRNFMSRDGENISVAYPVLEEEIEPIYECLKEYLKNNMARQEKIVCPKCGSDNLGTDRNFPNERHCDNGCSFWFKINS